MLHNSGVKRFSQSPKYKRHSRRRRRNLNHSTICRGRHIDILHISGVRTITISAKVEAEEAKPASLVARSCTDEVRDAPVRIRVGNCDSEPNFVGHEHFDDLGLAGELVEAVWPLGPPAVVLLKRWG
jgi:hypothetical protein